MPPSIGQHSRILIVKPSSMGDVVHSMPVLNAIKSSFPNTEVDWVIAKGLEGLLRGHQMISGIVVINKDDWKALKNIASTGREIAALFRRLRDGRYDIVIDLQGLLRSALITATTGAPIRMGFADAREGSPFFYSHTLWVDRDIHAVDRYLKIASALGCNTDHVEFPLPEYSVEDNVANLISSIKRYIVVIPGARWKTKRWPMERFAELINMCKAPAVLIGGSDDKIVGATINRLCKGRAIDLTGKTTIGDVVSLIRHSRAVVTNDTGPMHIAAALNKPVVALFGPTNPVRTGPYGPNNIVIKAALECAPCYKKSCSKGSCMNIISAQDVYGALEKMII